MLDKNLWHQAQESRGALVRSVVAGVICGVMILWQAYLLAMIVNHVFMDGWSLAMLWPLLGGLLLVMTLRACLSWLEEWFALGLAQGVQRSLRQAIMLKIDRLGPVAIGGAQVGELITMVGEGIDLLEEYFSKYLPQLFKCAIIPMLFLLFIFPIDWVSGLILLLTVPLAPFFMMLIGKWTENVNRQQWALLNRLTGYLQDVLAGLSTLQMLNRSRQQGDKIAQVSEDYRIATLSVLRWAFLSALTLELLTTLSIAVVSVGLGVRLVEGMLDFQSAFFLLLLAPEFYLPLRALGGYFHASLNGVAAAETIYRFLALPEPTTLSSSKRDLPDSDLLEVTFDHVSYCYPGSIQNAVTDLCFTLAPSEKVGLVGLSGSGKTTILNLLLGFIRPDSGQILVNGIDLTVLNQSVFNDHLALIPQNPYIFADTIRANILLGNPGFQEERLNEVADQLGLTRLLADLPHGLDTSVGQGGQNLSGGQQQLVVMTRAVLKDADLILMDEATNNLDLLSEQQVQNALPLLLAQKGALVIAHRLSTITQMDRIMVLEQGRVVEVGSHQVLLAQKGRYAHMIEKGENDDAQKNFGVVTGHYETLLAADSGGGIFGRGNNL